jgi:hydrogenase nickel incorporation protein HypB
VCPSSYDLGEDLRVVMLSVTEGEDKPLKYPNMFKTADVVIVNKSDIAEVVGFDREAALNNIRRIAPQATLFEVSARTGQGMEQWYQFLERQLAADGR